MNPQPEISSASPAAPSRRRRVLAVLGDVYHPAEPRAEYLTSLAAQGAGFDLEVCTDAKSLDVACLDGLDLLIIARIGLDTPGNWRTAWMSPAWEACLAGWVARGGKLLAWHAGLASYDANRIYLNLVKGTFSHHPEPCPQDLRCSPAAMWGAGSECDATFTDEQYFFRFSQARTHIFATVFSPEHGFCPAAWGHSLGAGQVVAWAPGHTDEAISQPGLAKIIGSLLAGA